ncbi:hypothetical protein DFH27DRAFT_555293 [Peziza echinospora]|nr:hypothetical protein DFH27DRAFT_555293 [Peziza echinospora]
MAANSSLLHQFLATLNRAITNKDGQFFANILVLSPQDIAQNQLMSALRAEVLGLTPAYIENACYEVLGEEWTSLTDMVVGYVGSYLRDVDVPGVVAGRDVSALQSWFDGLGSLMGQISSAFGSVQGILLLPLVKITTNVLTSLAIRIDQLTQDPRQSAANDASRIVLRAFNVALGDRTTGSNLGKKEAAFHLANLLFKLYFKLDQTRLSPTIHTNLQQSLLIPLLPTNFPKAQHTTYTYYLGRHHLSLATVSASHLLPAFTALSTSHSLCLPLFLSQRRQILIYLLASAILIGKTPSRAAIYNRLPESQGLDYIFSPIVHALKKGDFRAFHAHISACKGWLKRKGLYLLLLTRGEELLWRSLARRCFILKKELTAPINPFNLGTAKTPPPQLRLADLCRAANYLHRKSVSRISHERTLFSEDEEETFSIDDIEGVVLDLLDQGLIKGYIARQQKVVVLKREGNGFVGVEEARRWKASSAGTGGEDGAEWGTSAGGGAAGAPKMKMGGVVRLTGLKTIGS